ncbi:uncharacterized protein EI90DRAFT_3082384, partial [Cantharellus anzutake]|uniref:uncharacterized protein n=1 Tax=Cantharellus anzutake TaxID=1750568 RepID=UPI001907E084
MALKALPVSVSFQFVIFLHIAHAARFNSRASLVCVRSLTLWCLWLAIAQPWLLEVS